ncbi:MAG: transcriptional repressor [Myxococcales bacterium]|nr:transcriptional repressor [Myxococcales bacterium]
MVVGYPDALRRAGLRVTQPRVELLSLLDCIPEPITHGDAVKLLGDKGGDPATTYRNLIRLVDVGLARIASVVGGVTYFERMSTDGKQHPHFHCQKCGTISCLQEAQITSAPPPSGPWNEALQEARLTFVGRCPNCRP